MTTHTMAGLQEKKVRKQCLINFSRSVNIFNRLHESNSLIDQLTQAFDKVVLRWDSLEAAQDAFIAVTDDAEVDTEMKYLDEPEGRYQDVLVAYDAYKRKTIAYETKLREENAASNQQVEDDRRLKEVQNAKDIEIARIEAEKNIQFDSLVAEFNLEVDAFSKTNNSVQAVVKDASDDDKRRAFEK